MLISSDALATTVTTTGNARNECPDADPEDCCISFTINFTEATDHVRISLLPSGQSDGCIDISCWLAQDNYPFVEHTKLSNGTYDIKFSPAKGNGDSYTFTMCAPDSCWARWSAVRWFAYNDENSIDDGLEYLHACWYGQAGCNGCDKTELFQQGTDIVVCFSKKGSAGTACSLKVVISPALQSCNDEGGGTGPADYVLQAPLGYSIANQISYPPPIDRTEILFVANSPGQCLATCYTTCFKIKGCEAAIDRMVHSIKVFNVDDSSASCDPPPTESFKPATGATWPDFELEQAQNYPNPVTALSGYTTLIPFEVGAAGEASLTIADENGAVVYTATMNPDAAGTFGFNVDAGTLASGRYFYKIEAPRGKLILAKTMLVVK